MTRIEAARTDGSEPPRRSKSPAAFRTTGEVAEALDVATHVLRFWEAKFPQVKPLKRGGGRRYYRPEDVDLLRRIRQCLYQEGYTIRGVQKLLRAGGLRSDGPAPPPADDEAAPALFSLEPPAAEIKGAANPTLTRQDLREALAGVRDDLLQIRTLISELLPLAKTEPS